LTYIWKREIFSLTINEFFTKIYKELQEINLQLAHLEQTHFPPFSRIFSIQSVHNCFPTLVSILKRNRSRAFNFPRISSFGTLICLNFNYPIFLPHESLSKRNQPFPKSAFFLFPMIQIFPHIKLFRNCLFIDLATYLCLGTNTLCFCKKLRLNTFSHFTLLNRFNTLMVRIKPFLQCYFEPN
jgi:hypothetical protein